MDASAHIQAFVRDLGVRRRLDVLTQTVLGTLVFAAPPWLVVWILWPPLAVRWLPALLALVGLRVVWAVFRHQLWRPLPRRGRFPLLAVDRGLGLGDRLATWHSLRGDDAMAEWLERDLAQELAAVPADAVRGLWGRRLKRCLRWLPLILLLLLLKLLSPFLPGLRDRGGVAPGSTELADGRGEGGADTIGDPEPSTSGKTGDPTPPPAEGSKPVPPRPEEPIPNLPGPPDAPKELEQNPIKPPRPIDESLGAQREFVVPAFVGEGETRRQAVQQALLEQGGAAPETPAGRGAGLPEDPEARAAALERAAEVAVRSRHVPPEEKPFVRQWFDRVRTAPNERGPDEREPDERGPDAKGPGATGPGGVGSVPPPDGKAGGG